MISETQIFALGQNQFVSTPTLPMNRHFPPCKTLLHMQQKFVGPGSWPRGAIGKPRWLPMNLPLVAADVRRRLLWESNDFRLVTSAATGFRGSTRESSVRRILSPALFPRRGRILRRVSSQGQPSVLRQFSPANLPSAATSNSTPELPQRVRSLSPLHEPPARSRRREEAVRLGIQRPPPRYLGGYRVQGFNARIVSSANSLPGGEGMGEGERHTNFSANRQPLRLCPFALLRFQLLAARNVRLHSRLACTIVPHASAGRHRGRRMGGVVSHDATRTLARQRRVVGALSFHRRFA
jgi:hypothetical protein